MGYTRRDALAAGLLPLAGCQAPITRSRSATRAARSVDGAARIGFGGDVMLARRVERAHADGPPASVWGSMIDRLDALDGLVANLECVLAGSSEPWPSKTWRFRADPAWAVPALEAAGTAAVSLANNHSLDYGADALAETVAHLETGAIAHAGAGPDRDAALEPAVAEIGGLRIAMVGFTDRFAPFAAAADAPGTAHLSLSVDDRETRLAVFEALERADRADPDLVVASLHWGPNYEPKTPAHRAFGRWLIDQGVDVVHGHSAHAVAGVEVYRGRPIVYDAGDLVNDYSPVAGHRNDRGLLVELRVDDGLDSLRLVPIEIRTAGIEVAGDAARSWLAAEVRSRSAPFGTPIETVAAGAELSIPLSGG